MYICMCICIIKTSNANLVCMLQATSIISWEPSHTCTCVHAMKMIYQWDGQLDLWMGWANVVRMLRPSTLILQQNIACISWGIVDCTYEPHIAMLKDIVHVCKVICAFKRCYYTSWTQKIWHEVIDTPCTLYQTHCEPHGVPMIACPHPSPHKEWSGTCA